MERVVTSPSAYLGSEEDIRLMAKVARMYHEHNLSQSRIAADLFISQARVSRLLKRAVEVGVVRTTVALPAGVHTELEEELEKRYGLSQAVLTEAWGLEESNNPALGAATADYLASTLVEGDVIGISSWSAALLATVSAMRPLKGRSVRSVVQLVGGLGDTRVQVQATRMIGQFASYTGAEPLLMPTPGVLGSARSRLSLMSDPGVQDIASVWDRLTVALVGIGALEPSNLLRLSGNTFGQDDLQVLAREGAVGDICFRYFDDRGVLVESDFNERVMGISAEQLLKVPRRVGIAGGSRKVDAIKAALTGGWINVLVTDVETALAILSED